MDIEQMKIVAKQGKGKKYGLGEDRPIRTVNKNMKCPFEGHLMQRKKSGEKCGGKAKQKKYRSRRNEGGRKRG